MNFLRRDGNSNRIVNNNMNKFNYNRDSQKGEFYLNTNDERNEFNQGKETSR